MPRLEKWEKLPCGVEVRIVTVTWTRAEVLARVMNVKTFRHKRLIAKQWQNR